MPKELHTRISNKYDTYSNWATLEAKDEFTPLNGELIIYGSDEDSNTTAPKIKVGDGSKNIKQLNYVHTGSGIPDVPEQLVPVTRPTLVKSSYYYTGYTVDLELENFDSSKMRLTYHQDTRIDVGTYVAQIELLEGFCWEDTNKQDTLFLNWEIIKSGTTIRVTSDDLTLNLFEKKTINFTYSPKVLTKQDVDFVFYDADYNDVDVVAYEITSMEDGIGQVEFQVRSFISTELLRCYYNIKGSDNWYSSYSEFADLSYTSVSNVLDEADWETISSIAKSGLASTVWNIGDTKEVIIKGNIGGIEAPDGITGHAYILSFGYTSTAFSPEIMDIAPTVANSINSVDFGLSFSSEDFQKYCLVGNNYNNYAADGFSHDNYHNILTSIYNSLDENLQDCLVEIHSFQMSYGLFEHWLYDEMTDGYHKYYNHSDGISETTGMLKIPSYSELGIDPNPYNPEITWPTSQPEGEQMLYTYFKQGNAKEQLGMYATGSPYDASATVNYWLRDTYSYSFYTSDPISGSETDYSEDLRGSLNGYIEQSTSTGILPIFRIGGTN